MIYFDNAATTGKKPKAVIKAVETALLEYSANPGRSGHTLSVRAADTVYRVREKTAEFFGASGPENIVFTLNCTHSINCVLKGLLRQGDHAVISSMEHNAVMRPLKKIGIPFDIAEVSLENDDETLKELAKKIKPNTKLVFCTGASNVCGKILPLRQIGELCRKRGVLFGVDAAQIAGVVPINIKQMKIDFLCIAPHKGLYAPMGVGILICERPLPNTVLEGGTGTNSADLFQPQLLPERHESGTLNLPGIMGIGAGIDYVKQLGTEKISNHETGIIKTVYFGLRNNPEAVLYTPEPFVNSYAPVLSFNISGVPSGVTANLLAENGIAVRGGLHCAPMAHRQLNTLDTGTVRLSTATFNTYSEAEAFLRLVNSQNFLKKLKKAIE
ncbi:MAG: aminotransferase class V-fold PLP-dependent enzyme [Clostridia bacterium]|nr:aminotransferase class V-fold PLP-dependent enzyme [Clostridia bacterium]